MLSRFVALSVSLIQKASLFQLSPRKQGRHRGSVAGRPHPLPRRLRAGWGWDGASTLWRGLLTLCPLTPPLQFVWPRSHLAVHRYYKAWPEDLPNGGALNDKVEGDKHGLPSSYATGMTADHMQRVCPGGYDGGAPVEVTMQAGDLLVWHHWCVHANSRNDSDRVRQAIFSRFHTTRWKDELLVDEGGVSTDGNLWKYWSDALDASSESRSRL